MKTVTIITIILFMCNTVLAHKQQLNSPTIIQGNIWSSPNDTIIITYYNYKLGSINVGSKTIKHTTNDGSFHFTLPTIKHPFYCSITSTRWQNLLLNDQLLEPGDSLVITADTNISLSDKTQKKSLFKIIGRNADKNQLLHEWEFALRYNRIPGITPIIVNNYNTLLDGLIIIEKNRVQYTKYLDSLINAVSTTISKKIKAALLNDVQVRSISTLLNINRHLFDKYSTIYGSTHHLTQLLTEYKKYIDPMVLQLFDDYDFEICSPDFLKMAVQKIMMDTRWEKGENGMMPAMNYLKQAEKWPTQCRQEVITALTSYFYHHNISVGNINEMLVRALPLVQKNGLKELLENYQKIYTPGNLVYPFELEDINGKKLKIRDFKDKTVVIDFWFTGCRACIGVSRYLKMIQNRVAEDTGIVFISVSIDKDKSTWLNSVKQGIYTHSEFINVYTNGEGSKHPFIGYYGISSYPHVLIVGRDNKLFTSNPPLSTNKDDIELFVQTILDAGKK